VPPDASQAIEVLSIGCQAGNGDACTESGRLLLRASGADRVQPTPAMVARAEGLFQVGCRAGSGTSHAKCCGLLAALHLSPTLSSSTLKPSPRPAELVSFLERACKGEHAPSCMKLAEGFWSGAAGETGALLELPMDQARARSLEITGLQWSGLSPQQAARTVEKKRGLTPPPL